MKIECVKEPLQRVMNKLDKITSRNLTLPILSCVLFSVKNKQLVVKATNLDIGVEFSIPVKVIKEGEFTAPSNLVSGYLSSVNNKNITIEVEDGTVIISSTGSRTTIKTLNHEDFPIIPKVPKDTLVSVSSKDFISGVKSVWYAASPSSIKPELSSIYIYSTDGKIIFVTTDSFRLAERQMSFKSHDPFPPILIPFKNIPEIIRCLEDGDAVIDVAVTKNQIAFMGSNFYITSRVVDGIFPDYKQIIPKNTTTEALMLKEDVLNALHLANIFTDKFNQVSFSVYPKSKKFEIKSRNAELGESVENVASTLSGEDIDVNFNYRYIVDAFQSINSDSITFSFSGTQKPLVIKGVSDSGFLYLVMPMNR